MALNTKKTAQDKKFPSYKAYHVSDGDNGFWTEIGAAWDHEDGNGFTLNLDLIPISTGRVVLRKYDPKQDKADTKKAA